VILAKGVEHEADESVSHFDRHADHVSFSQAANKVALGPWISERSSLDLQHDWHVSADHPSDVSW
jgi:hypothetical protein